VCFPETVEWNVLAKAIQDLNASPAIHGILFHLSIPPHLDPHEMILLLDPRKDVDGLHPLNQGQLFAGHQRSIVSCTPLGCLLLLRHFGLSVQLSHLIGARHVKRGACVIDVGIHKIIHKFSQCPQYPDGGREF